MFRSSCQYVPFLIFVVYFQGNVKPTIIDTKNNVNSGMILVAMLFVLDIDKRIVSNYNEFLHCISTYSIGNIFDCLFLCVSNSAKNVTKTTLHNNSNT